MDPAVARALGALLEVGLALLFGLSTVWIGVRTFDRMTPRLDEMAELKRGNLAVGVLLAGVVLALAIVVRGGVEGVARAFVVGGTARDWIASIGIALLQLLVALAIGIGALRAAYWAFDQVTQEIDEEAEIARGNVPVALVLATVLVAVALAIAAAMDDLAAALS